MFRVPVQGLGGLGGGPWHPEATLKSRTFSGG